MPRPGLGAPVITNMVKWHANMLAYHSLTHKHMTVLDVMGELETEFHNELINRIGYTNDELNAIIDMME